MEKCMLEQLKEQHSLFVMQRDQALTNYNQVLGAIFACEQMIKKLEEQGEKDNVRSDEQAPEQASQE